MTGKGLRIIQAQDPILDLRSDIPHSAPAKAQRDQTLSGSTISASPGAVNFRDVLPDERREISVLLENCNDRVISLNSFSFSNNQESLFSLEPANTINIPPGGNRIIRIHYRQGGAQVPPAQTGLKLASIKLLRDNDEVLVDLPIRANVVEERTAGEVTDAVTIPAISAAPGEEFLLPVILTKFMPRRNLVGYSCRISFNASVMTPVDPDTRSIVANGKQTLLLNPVNAQGLDFAVGDTLHQIPMIAMLGNVAVSTMEIEGFSFIVRSADRPLDNIDLQHGVFSLDGLYYEDGIPRLVNPNQGPLEIEIVPNPLIDEASVFVKYFGPTELGIFDALGNPLRDLSRILPRNENSFTSTLPRSVFPAPGLYFLWLRTPDFSMTRIIVVAN